MFRRLPNTLPKDPVFPTSLGELGYFINDNDRIRQIRNPEQKYQFVVNKNERVNDAHKEAMNTVCRQIVDDRLQRLHLQTTRLPLGASENEPHVPIYTSPYIARKKRVVVLFGERNQDPTIFSYRVLGDVGINKGSIIDFVDTVLNKDTTITSDDDRPGIIITNPCQLYWYRGGGRAVSWSEWLGLPRESAVHEAPKVDPIKNTIPGNRDFREHVRYILDKAIPALVHDNAKLDIIGLEWTGTAVLEYLCRNWPQWSGRINGICFGGPQHNINDLLINHAAPQSLVDFIARKSRAYFVSDQPLEVVLPGRDGFGCNRYSSGEALYQENVIVRSWRSMLDWFIMVNATPTFEEVSIVLPAGEMEQLPN